MRHEGCRSQEKVRSKAGETACESFVVSSTSTTQFDLCFENATGWIQPKPQLVPEPVFREIIGQRTAARVVRLAEQRRHFVAAHSAQSLGFHEIVREQRPPARLRVPVLAIERAP